MFQSQTGSPSSSDLVLLPLTPCTLNSFNPKREAHPLQTGRSSVVSSVKSLPFQSQTGSPSSSDRRASSSPRTSDTFQSQTGSPSSSDQKRLPALPAVAARFNPKREAHPLQTWASSVCRAAWQTGRFNPKREAHPLQTLPQN